MTDNKDLIARLENAEGPDRELDREIAIALGWTDYREFVPMGHGWKNWHKDAAGKIRTELPEWTASFDAAIALVEEVLPGWEWAIEKEDTTYDGETASLFRFELGSQIQEEHKSLAIVPLIALLKAKTCRGR